MIKHTTTTTATTAAANELLSNIDAALSLVWDGKMEHADDYLMVIWSNEGNVIKGCNESALAYPDTKAAIHYNKAVKALLDIRKDLGSNWGRAFEKAKVCVKELALAEAARVLIDEEAAAAAIKNDTIVPAEVEVEVSHETLEEFTRDDSMWIGTNNTISTAEGEDVHAVGETCSIQ